MKFLLTLSLLLSTAFAQEARRIEVLFLGDKGHHKPIERVPQLMAALGPKGINITYTDDLSDLNPKTLGKYDALMVFANWDTLPAPAEKALLDFVASGKGFLPIHCASYCFRNSSEYVKLVGGQFWRHTMDSITAQIVQPQHAVMADLKPFTAYDETYLHSQLQPDNNVLAVREIKADQKKDKPGASTEPYTWTRTHGKGKVFYTAYGHDERTWQLAGFQELLYNGIIWSVNDVARAAHVARAPQKFEYRTAKLPNYEQRPGIQYQQLALNPEESMKHIQVPVDFNLELFAAEPNVMHPIALSWDEKGKLYVLITKDYPNERKQEGGSDYIMVCEDTDKDGKADKFTPFAEGLSIPTGMVFANGGLIVSQAPHMLFLKDTDGDGKADLKKILFTGFGTGDTHAGPSNLHYGFDNWIWGCVGYSGFKGKVGTADSLQFGQAFFRFKADGSKLEWMTNTSNNTWGFAFNETNDVFGSTANNSHGWYMAIPHSYFNAPNNNGSRSTDTHRDMKPITEKVRQVDAFGGFTAASGHNFYTARAFPKKYWNSIAFVSEPTGHILHQNNMQKKGTDFYDKESFNLMAGADEWFSPVFSEVGPDGAVWVADWYSYIIQHNPTPKGFDNGPGNAYLTDLRDFTHGRIYRVSYKEAPEYKPLSLSLSDAKGLLAALKNNNMFWRMHAQRMLVERGQKDVVADLIALVNDKSVDEIGINAPAIHALWTLKGLNALDEATIAAALSHPCADVRKNTIKVMDFSAASVATILKNNVLQDKDPLVVMNALLLFSQSPLDAAAEQAFFARMNKSTEVEDRWMPDAFACVLTANNAKLMKKHLQNQIKASNSKKTAMPAMDHSMHQMGGAKAAPVVKVDGIDLVVADIKIDPATPAVRERINITVEVKNQGTVDLEKENFVPLDIRFEGMGIKVDQISRNFKEGIKAGETVSITKNLNGPWVGNISVGTDVVGDYNLTVAIDKANEVKESNKNNNAFTKKISFSRPADMNAFALESALKSYANKAPADSLVSILKSIQAMEPQSKNGIVKAMAEGWNYRLKDIKLTEANKQFLASVNSGNSNERLSRLMTAWGIATEGQSNADVLRIKISTIKEAMKFSLKEFTVKPGQSVEIAFENPDAMQHNMVITKPGMLEKVGRAGDAMMKDTKGADKNYVPAIAEVLFSTPLVNPGQNYTLRFKAPANTGDYPFVCTFPGHWSIMNGVMKVRN
ncbi:MAG: hypothetical protein RIT36_784 [Bacteroidota bacterium]